MLKKLSTYLAVNTRNPHYENEIS